ncbi:MAG: cell wall hydrolase [Bacillota bacterium]|nr:cell wall hydrolase [Bacillota bacterium]
MPYDTRELLARLIQCEAGGEGENGMKAVATVVMNRATVPYGAFSRINGGTNIQNIIFQEGQFVCAAETVDGVYNPQNIYNMNPEEIHYDIADWALAGNILPGVDNALYFYNPYSTECLTYFPPYRLGVIHNRIGDHCFYIPTSYYAET